jgi:hypothetical protein
MMRGRDLADVREWWNARETTAEVFPGATVVPRKPHLPVVRADIEHAGAKRRLVDGDYRCVFLGAGGVARDAA